METVLKLRVENYEVVINRRTKTYVNKLQVKEETGLTWSVWKNGIVEVFNTFCYNENIYSFKSVAVNGINWIANLEKTPKQRFAKAAELKFKYLNDELAQ